MCGRNVGSSNLCFMQLRKQEDQMLLFFFHLCVFIFNHFRFIVGQLWASCFATCTSQVQKSSSPRLTLSLTTWLPGPDATSVPGPPDAADLSATPPQILQLHPPIQFIAIPDTPGYPIVPLSFSPSVIGLPIPNAAAPPTFIFGGYSAGAVAAFNCHLLLLELCLTTLLYLALTQFPPRHLPPDNMCHLCPQVSAKRCAGRFHTSTVWFGQNPKRPLCRFGLVWI